MTNHHLSESNEIKEGSTQNRRCEMEDYLYQKDLDLPLGEKLELMHEKEWNLLDRKVLGAMRLTL